MSNEIQLTIGLNDKDSKKELAQKLAQEMAQVFNQESIVYKVSEIKELDFIGA